MLASIKLALRYAILAGIATLLNLGSQEMTVRFYQGIYELPLAMLVGTGIGLWVKYLLDKRYIFRFKARSIGHDTWAFTLYSLMGVLTTMIFWGFEWAFDAIYQSREMRYLGALMGLSIGYITKYQLDRRFVFGLRR